MLKLSSPSSTTFSTQNLSPNNQTPPTFTLINPPPSQTTMLVLNTLLGISALFGLTAAAPSGNLPNIAGEITFFEPGLGACGQVHGPDDFIAAVSHIRYDRESLCGRMLRVTRDGRSADVRVVDRCAGCKEDDIDLSPAAFRQVIGDLGLGRVNGNWEWI
ncbi:hypothetical protein S40288_00709 [Stachybotrys chartarum IBT 40288]|nr:hypothetical protein S40288_00709 [Stachybotrys chartarum IBT 40288]